MAFTPISSVKLDFSFYVTFGVFVYSIFMITVQMILLIPNNSNLDETYQYFLDMGMDEL